MLGTSKYYRYIVTNTPTAIYNILLIFGKIKKQLKRPLYKKYILNIGIEMTSFFFCQNRSFKIGSEFLTKSLECQYLFELINARRWNVVKYQTIPYYSVFTHGPWSVLNGRLNLVYQFIEFFNFSFKVTNFCVLLYHLHSVVKNTFKKYSR